MYKKKRRCVSSNDIEMPKTHFQQLGEYPEPEEAQELEDISGYEDWSDYPEEEKKRIKSVVIKLHEFVKTCDPFSQKAFDRYCRKVCGNSSEGMKRKGGGFIRKSQLIAGYRELLGETKSSGTQNNETGHPSLQESPLLEEALLKKRTKSHSGVLVISVIMGPGKFSCPKDCHYCPNQPGVARSYLLKEPGVLRGYRNGWDPLRQFNDRARALENNGHIIDKIEIIILGGTFSFYPNEYAEEFITALYYAANIFYESERRIMGTLSDEIARNEVSQCRIIGLTIETRPDYITFQEIKRLRTYGTTRVQLGLQHIDDAILDYVNRDCPTWKSKEAIKKLLNCGFKVDGHWMPDLPGSSYEKDLEMFRFLLDDQCNTELQVDQWKVYPTATVPHTKIKEWFENGTYKPYGQKDAGRWMVQLLTFILQSVPYRIRLNRVVRDIPSSYIVAGECRTNLRQEVEKEMKKLSIVCRDIRERECKGESIEMKTARLHIDVFEASGGVEYYMSIENETRTKLFGHLRLRIPSIEKGQPHPIPELQDCALLRELHTYGKLVAVNSTNSGKETQHVGVGKRLVVMAEMIALERHACAKMAIISGVGAREYYRKLGYSFCGTYMIKEISVPSTTHLLDQLERFLADANWSDSRPSTLGTRRLGIRDWASWLWSNITSVYRNNRNYF